MFWTATRTISMVLPTLLLLVVFLVPVVAHSQLYTKENFLFTYHYKPASFTITKAGGFVGILENGSSFTQQPILTEQAIRLHKFTIGNATFYISDRGTFQASNDLNALSIYMYIATT